MPREFPDILPDRVDIVDGEPYEIYELIEDGVSYGDCNPLTAIAESLIDIEADDLKMVEIKGPFKAWTITPDGPGIFRIVVSRSERPAWLDAPEDETEEGKQAKEAVS